jgi:glycosyltransferase involved in cell wall biosynthesis
VGGGQWYKNRLGVVELYAAYVESVTDPLPLWMVGPKDQPDILDAIASLPSRARVYLFSGIDAHTLNAAYAHAALFLFPSLDEGFGWPIIEAQASGTLVLTTNAEPMTEVGGSAAFYIDRRCSENKQLWASVGAAKISEILMMDAVSKASMINFGFINAARFDADVAISGYAAIYEQIINEASYTL